MLRDEESELKEEMAKIAEGKKTEEIQRKVFRQWRDKCLWLSPEEKEQVFGVAITSTYKSNYTTGKSNASSYQSTD